MRRPAVFLATLTLLAPLHAVAPTSASTAACELEAMAAIRPTEGELYRFAATGSTVGCVFAGDAVRPAISIGQVVKKRVRIRTGHGLVSGTARYRQPLATGGPETVFVGQDDGCATFVDGIAFVDGGRAIVEFWTSATKITHGTVIPSTRLRLVRGSARPRGAAPARYTARTTSATLPVGTTMAAELFFQPGSELECPGERRASYTLSGGVLFR